MVKQVQHTSCALTIEVIRILNTVLLFAGVAPISDPRLAVIVVVENPRGQYYGGLVAAPVFARIMQESLRLMNVPLDKPLETAKAKP